MVLFREALNLENAARFIYPLIMFPVSLQNQLIPGGLEPVLSQTEKLCISLDYIHFFYKYRNSNIRLKLVLIL